VSLRAPDPGVPFYWFSAGDILSRDPEAGARAFGAEAAIRLHRFHLAELALAARAGRRAASDFHRARARELGGAIAALVAWRRAAQVA
jgi:hypothetical protein